jgi:hypothetical protein
VSPGMSASRLLGPTFVTQCPSTEHDTRHAWEPGDGQASIVAMGWWEGKVRRALSA